MLWYVYTMFASSVGWNSNCSVLCSYVIGDLFIFHISSVFMSRPCQIYFVVVVNRAFHSKIYLQCQRHDTWEPLYFRSKRPLTILYFKLFVLMVQFINTISYKLYSMIVVTIFVINNLAHLFTWNESDDNHDVTSNMRNRL